jgi:hypothetical protein
LPASAALAGWLGFILEANLATLRKGCDPSMGYGLSTFSDEWDGGFVSRRLEGRIGSSSVVRLMN